MRKTIDTPPDIKGVAWRNERDRRRKKEDRLPQMREGGPSTAWTLERAVQLGTACAWRDKNGAVPFPADSKDQKDWWNEQAGRQVQPNRRTLRMNTAGCHPETKKHSPSINCMQHTGKTSEVAAKRKREAYESLSRMNLGHDQQNAVEGVAIHLLIVFFRELISTFDRDWEVMPVFDGLEADFMMRKKDWADVWVPLQMKSSGCIPGIKTNYHLKRGDYPNVFCVCVGMTGFVNRTTDVRGPNDIANAPGCAIAEIWHIGSCKDIEKSLGPTFGTPYSKFDASRRLNFGATLEAKRTFAEKLLRGIESWDTRLPRTCVFYEISDTINSKTTRKCNIEKNGFKVVDTALHTCGLRVDPVWRQNECVDYAVVSVDSGEPLVFVSGKTGSEMNGDPNQRQFLLSGAPNKRFCDVVIASYSGAHHRVAVMSRDTVYVEGMKFFRWNEKHLKPGVRVFNDISTPEAAKTFADYILSCRSS